MVCSHWIRGFVHLSSTFLSFCTVATCSFSCLTRLTLQRSCIVLQGQWGSWGSWSSCPVSCGGSTQNRSRIQLVAQAGRGLPCEGIRFVLICLFSKKTAIALGSSAIVKVSGRAELLSDHQWFSGADPCWAAQRLRGRFDQGSAKVPPGFHQGSTKVLQGFTPRFSKFCGVRFSSVLGCQKVPGKVPPRFCHGSTKVPQSLFSKVPHLSLK